MKKEDVALALGIVSVLGLAYFIYAQGKINKAQALLDNKLISASQLYAEKLGIENMPNTNIVDSGAGKQ